jgi:hypothetical protein
MLPERRWAKAHAKRVVVMVLVYGAVLVPTLRLQSQLSGSARYLVSALPVVPFAALPLVMVRVLQTVDERERSLVYRSIAVAFFVTATLTFGYGFLENAGAPKLSMFCIWPVMATAWAVGRLVAPRLP